MSAEKIFRARAELKRMAKPDLLKLVFHQKEKNCVLGGNCPFLLEYQSILFCISEIMGQGCQAEKVRMLSGENHQQANEFAQKAAKNKTIDQQRTFTGLWNPDQKRRE